MKWELHGENSHLNSNLAKYYPVMSKVFIPFCDQRIGKLSYNCKNSSWSFLQRRYHGQKGVQTLANKFLIMKDARNLLF